MRLFPTAVLMFPLIAGAAFAHSPDPTRLPLGDDRLSENPRPGYIMECHTDPDAGGAFRDGDWIDTANGTWNLLEKVSVEGEVVHSGWYFHYGVQGDERLFATADIPEHATGEFPVAPDDPAYQFDRNPNTIAEQDFVFGIPAEPSMQTSPAACPAPSEFCVPAWFFSIHSTRPAVMPSPTRPRISARAIRRQRVSITIIPAAPACSNSSTPAPAIRR